MSGTALAVGALKLVGTCYRRDGRDAATGLDCVGVLSAVLAAVGQPAPLPARHAMRRRQDPDLAAHARACGLSCVTGPVVAGDVLLVRCSPLQLHLLVAVAAEQYVHAHAGLGRVVLGPRDPAWTPVRHWRHASTLED